MTSFYIGMILVILSVIWLGMGILLYLLKNIPFYGSLQQPGESYEREVERNLEQQQRLVRFWWRRLWPLGATALIAGIAVLAAR